MSLPSSDPALHSWFTLRQALSLASLSLLTPALLVPLYAWEVGATVLQIGLCVAAFPLAVWLLRRPAARWGRRWGWRVCFLAGLGGNVLALLALALAREVGVILLGRFLQGAAWALTWLAAGALAAEWENGHLRLRQARTRGALIGVLLAFALLTTGLSLGWHGEGQQSNFPGAWTLLFGGYALVGFSALLRARHALGVLRANQGQPAGVVLDELDGDEHRLPRETWPRLALGVSAAAWGLTTLLMLISLREKLALGVDGLLWVFLPAAVVEAFAWPSSPLAARLRSLLAERIGMRGVGVAGLLLAAANSFLLVSVSDVVLLAVLWAFQAVCLRLLPSCRQESAAAEEWPGADFGAALGPVAGALLYAGGGGAAAFYATGIVLAFSAVMLAWGLSQPPGEA